LSLAKAKAATAAANVPNCQLRNHSPERIGPMRSMRKGAIHVPDISVKTAPILMALTSSELKPEWSRNVTIVGPKDRTVR
jgi:hypothetical protein